MQRKSFLFLAALLVLGLLLTTIPVFAADQRVLRVTFAWPDVIDPAMGNDYAGSSSIVNLYDTLVFPNAKGGVDPWLATSWNVSANGMTYTFHLRAGVTFHDGAALKASDVVASYDRLKTIGRGFAYLVTPDIAAVRAPDARTVVFTLVKPTALFLPSLVRLYVAEEALVKKNTKAEGAYGAHGDYGTAWLQTHDAGSGPYMVKEFPLEQYLLMTRNAKWWGKFNPRAPDEVRFIGTTEGVTVRTLMQNKQLEITDQWQSFEAYQALEKIDGVKIAPLSSMTSFYYMMNTKKAPTDDLHFRRVPDLRRLSGLVNWQAAGNTTVRAVYFHRPPPVAICQVRSKHVFDGTNYSLHTAACLTLRQRRSL